MQKMRPLEIGRNRRPAIVITIVDVIVIVVVGSNLALIFPLTYLVVIMRVQRWTSAAIAVERSCVVERIWGRLLMGWQGIRVARWSAGGWLGCCLEVVVRLPPFVLRICGTAVSTWHLKGSVLLTFTRKSTKESSRSNCGNTPESQLGPTAKRTFSYCVNDFGNSFVMTFQKSRPTCPFIQLHWVETVMIHPGQMSQGLTI